MSNRDPITDVDIEWKRKRKRWDAWPDLATGLIVAAVTETGSDAFAEGELIQSPNAASKVAPDVSLLEVSDYGLVGIQFLDDADLMFFCKQMPYDLDPTYDIGFRLNYCQTDAGVTTTLWKLSVGFDKKDAVLQAEDAAGIAALDTVIAAKASAGAALENLWTARGIRSAPSFLLSDVEDGMLIRFTLELDTTNDNDAHILLGLEMDYVAKRTYKINKEDSELGHNN